MPNEAIRRVARVDKLELADMPADWTDGERGQYLRLLLKLKGIDPGRLYTVAYYPHRHCWLLSQDTQPGQAAITSPSASPGPKDELFYLQVRAEFRRTALAAFAALASQSPHFAQFGCHYQLPDEPQEMTPAELAKLLGAPREEGTAPRFDAEGGWETGPSEN